MVATPSCCACCCCCCLTTVLTASVIEATTVAQTARHNGLERGRRVRLALAAGSVLPLAILVSVVVSDPLPAELVGAVAAPLVVGLWVFVLATARGRAGDDRRTAWRVSGLHALYTVLFTLGELLVGAFLLVILRWGYLALALGVPVLVWWRLHRFEAPSG